MTTNSSHTENVKFYLVGGAVRDQLLGLTPKDLDYVCVGPSYQAMKEAIMARGGQIFLETEKFFTIRAKVPELGCSDFVLARKEGAYGDGRRPDSVEVGTLLEDLSRRDFSIGAIAKDEEGNFIDPFGGIADIKTNSLRCVGRAKDRFTEDSLRMLRAIRFVVMKNFVMDSEIRDCLLDEEMVSRLSNVSQERIREELFRCFSHDTIKTLRILENFLNLRQIVLGGKLWLKPTMEAR